MVACVPCSFLYEMANGNTIVVKRYVICHLALLMCILYVTL
jgi:hypothetical protein